MATYFAAQVKDMFFGLVERVTGYGWSEGQNAAGAQDEPTTKLASAVVSPTEEQVTVVKNIQIRPRSSADPIVSGGTKPQVN